MCCDKKLIGISLAIGLMITLLTSFSINTYMVGEFPDIYVVSLPILGVSYSGHPLPWVRQVVYPGAQKEIVLVNLVVDIIFWSGLLLLAMIFNVKSKKGIKFKRLRTKVSKKVKHRKKRKPKRRKKRR